MRCEDFPCCGHEAGCCPNYDESGVQTDMVCVCGARLPIDNPTSCCDSCLRDGDGDDAFSDYCEMDDDSMDGDFDSGMASAGHGMDEDYDHWCEADDS